MHWQEGRDPRGRWTIVEVHRAARLRATRNESAVRRTFAAVDVFAWMVEERATLVPHRIGHSRESSFAGMGASRHRRIAATHGPTPHRQMPDDELVEIADRPQLWISRDGYAKTLRAGLVRAAHIADRGRSPYPLESPTGVRVELTQMSRLWNRLRIVREKRPA